MHVYITADTDIQVGIGKGYLLAVLDQIEAEKEVERCNKEG